jgi:predicted metal-dependent hydrolase
MQSSTDIQVRDIAFGIADNPQRYWFAGDPYRTVFCDALSLCLPEGERFFIKSVRHYEHLATDAAQAEAIRNFVRQEAYHTREHEGYNAGLRRLGYDVDAMESLVSRALARKAFNLKALAVTCAIEHITATFSHQILSDPSYFDGVPARYRQLWLWHALEETEHKAVAMDLFVLAAAHLPRWKRYLLRVGAFTAVAATINRIIFRNALTMLRHDGVVTRVGPGVVYQVIKRMFFAPGFYRRSAGYFLRYYRPGFHPWDCDNHDLLDTWRERFPTAQGLARSRQA